MPTRFLLSTLLALSGVFVFPSFVSATVYYDTVTTASPFISTPWTNDNGNGVYNTGTESQNLHIVFSPSTNMAVDKISFVGMYAYANANATTTGCNLSLSNCDNYAVINVWRTSTTTFDSDKTFVASAGMTVLPQEEQDLSFEFDGLFYLLNGEDYIFELVHNGFYTPWVFSNGANWSLMLASTTVPVDTPNGMVYKWDDYTNTYGGSPEVSAGLKIELASFADPAVPIALDAPCVTSSWSYACTYGLASTTDVVTIVGTSTLDMSINDTTYMLVAKWISSNGNVFDESLAIVDVNNNPVRFQLTVSRTYDEEVSALSEIQVCQYFDDLSLMSGYTTIISDPTRCASVIIGADISTASTTALAGDLGWLDPETNLDAGWNGNPVPMPSDNVESDFVNFDYLYEVVKNFGVFAFFFPTMQILQLQLADYALTGTSSTSTDTTFDIPLDMSAFGLPATTAHLPVSEMFAEAENLSPDFFTYIDYFLWGFFWLFILSRILSGAWHGLPERGGGMSDKEYNERKYRHLVASSMDRDAGIMRGGRNKGYKW